MNKTSWRDVTEAELAATGKVKRPTQRYGNVYDRAKQSYEGREGQALEGATLAPVRSKYRNIKTVVDGIRFDSKREADHWLGLLARVRAGEITDLRRQVRFPLYCPEFDVQGDVLPGNCLQVAEYIADFTFLEAGKLVVVDAKARRISPYPLKAKWLFLQQGIEIVEV